MHEDLEESIQKFETKKEFVEVKLKTRQSFREDQVALERRLSKYRGDPARTMSGGTPDVQTNGHVHGHSEAVSGVGEIHSKLESIVLDLSQENGLQRQHSDSADGRCELENGQNKSIKKESMNVSGANDTVVITHEVGDKTATPGGQINSGYQRSATDVRHDEVNGQNTGNDNVTYENVHSNVRHDKVNGLFNDSVTYENWQSNGQLRHNLVTGDSMQERQPGLGHSTLIMRPKFTGHARSSMTPEPRMKVAKGIYQKNPKLTGASTEHLDNISVKSPKSGYRFHEQSRTILTQIPAAEVTSLPPDGNLCCLDVRQMVTVFRLLNVPDELVVKLSTCNVDGRRFAAFTDKDLDDLRMNNPIVRYFRDRSTTARQRRKKMFIL